MRSEELIKIIEQKIEKTKEYANQYQNNAEYQLYATGRLDTLKGVKNLILIGDF